MRSDVQALFVLDVSRSMLAAAGPTDATRLERAREAALELRAAIPEVRAGLAGLTDRALPYLFPTLDRRAFASTLQEAVTIESPPPQQVARVATSFDALAGLGTRGFFAPKLDRRVCVVLTDGESAPFTGPAAGCRLVVVQFWDPARARLSRRRAGAAVPAGRRSARRRRRSSAPSRARETSAGRVSCSAAAVGEGPVSSVAASERTTVALAPVRGVRRARARARARVRAPALAGSLGTSVRWSKHEVRVRSGALRRLVALCAGGGAVAADATGDWTGFGRTPDNNRHSPLTQIDRDNVDRMGRVFTVDLRRVDPDVRRGQQSYPLAIDGTLYVTTNNNFVFALDGVTGKVKWEYRPRNSGLFVNFGVAANRGLAYCGGKLFMTTLDMQLVALRPSDGEVVGKIAISQFVPNASANYGYSQTSAPICAGGKLVMGAAGSEYGVRGYVMAFNTDLTPAWPNPYWTIPPEQQQWRRLSRIVGGGVVWTPVTIDTRTSTVYFGTGSGTPNFYHDLHPGPNPRANSLIAVDLNTGKQRWWRQLVANDQWNYDVAQPPLVYDAKVGGKTRRIVSVASKEGVWFALDARSGQMLHERVKVIDRVEHPPLRPGQPVTIFPSALGGVNYSPASYDPATNYVFNAAAETAAVLIQDKLTPTQKRRKLIQGDVFLGLQNGNFGTGLESWHDHGSISAINVATGKRVWKFQTPGAGARRSDDDCERPRLRRRRRRRPPRLRHAEREGALALPDRRSDRGRADALPERRQGVPRDHGRGHADLVERRRRGRAAGVRDRRQPAAVVTAVRADTRGVRRCRRAERRRHADDGAGGRARARRGRGRSTAFDGRPDRGARLAPVRRQHRDRERHGCSSAAGRSPARGSRSTASS